MQKLEIAYFLQQRVIWLIFPKYKCRDLHISNVKQKEMHT